MINITSLKHQLKILYEFAVSHQDYKIGFYVKDNILENFCYVGNYVVNPDECDLFIDVDIYDLTKNEFVNQCYDMIVSILTNNDYL